MKITPIAIISQLAAITTAVQQDCHSIGYTIDGCGALGGERSTWKVSRFLNSHTRVSQLYSILVLVMLFLSLSLANPSKVQTYLG